MLVSSTSGVKNILQTNQMQQHVHGGGTRSLMGDTNWVFFGEGLFLNVNKIDMGERDA